MLRIPDRLAMLLPALCLASLLAPCPASAQATASARPIRFVVPFGPGGAGDITARVLAQKMSESMGQPIVVDNKPGGGGVVAAQAVATARPDGLTLLLMSNGMAVSAAMFNSLPFDTLKDFAPISTIGYFDMVVVGSPMSAAKTLPELLAAARSHPGKINVGTISVGSSQNLAAEMFKASAGIDVQIVPFNGTPALISALRGGHVDAAVEILAPMVTQIKGGDVRALAVMGDKRNTDLPNVPTVAEAGVPAFGVSAWNGIASTGKTPPDVVQRLNREVNLALASPDVRQRLADVSVEARGSTPEQLAQLLQSEIRRWSAVIERAGIPRQ